MGAIPGGLSVGACDPTRRAGSAWIRLAVAVWALAWATPAAAQEPDSIPPDTVPGALQVPIPPEAVASDTLPGDDIMPAVADSMREAPELPPFPDVLPTGWAFGRFELNRDELLRYRGLSLLDLLERIPGVVVTRSGGFGRVAGVSAMGAGGAAVRVFVDGYELDAIGQPTPELQGIGLADLESLRVERGAAGVRVDLATFRLEDARPYSEVEAAAGNYSTRLLRAMLSRPAGSRGLFSASYDLVTTNGVGLAEPFQGRGGRASMAYLLTPETGLRLELRQRSVTRGGVAYPVDVSRRDLLFGVRSARFPGITLEALVGRTWWRPDAASDEDGDGSAAVAVDTIGAGVDRTQGLLRAAWSSSFASLEASATGRSRDGGSPAPTSELALRGSIHPLPLLTAEGQVRVGSMDGAGITELRAGARLGPFSGLSLFGMVGTGERWQGLVRDTSIIYPDTVGIDTVAGEPVPDIRQRTRVETLYSSGLGSAAGIRVGGELTRWGGSMGAALVTVAAGQVAPFGFAFDRRLQPVAAGAASGVEAYADLPIPWTGGALRLDAHASSWADTGARPYLPAREARLGLEYHTVRIEGQFEPTVRLEAVHRGETLVPSIDGNAYDFVTPPYSLVNFFLQLRILDVRAFLIWENFTHNRLALDLPEGLGFQPGQRVVYGARWMFRN